MVRMSCALIVWTCAHVFWRVYIRTHENVKVFNADVYLCNSQYTCETCINMNVCWRNDYAYIIFLCSLQPPLFPARAQCKHVTLILAACVVWTTVYRSLVQYENTHIEQEDTHTCFKLHGTKFLPACVLSAVDKLVVPFTSSRVRNMPPFSDWLQYVHRSPIKWSSYIFTTCSDLYTTMQEFVAALLP